MHGEPRTHRARCLRHPDRTPTGQVVFFKDRAKSVKQSYTAKMKQKIDTLEGRQQYSRCLGIVEALQSTGLGKGEYPVKVILYRA